MNDGDPSSVYLATEDAIAILRFLDGLGGGGLLGYYNESDIFDYDGDTVPEAHRLGRVLLEALRPGFEVGDKVVQLPDADGEVGTIIWMELFPSGWEISVEWDRRGTLVMNPGALAKALT